MCSTVERTGLATAKVAREEEGDYVRVNIVDGSAPVSARAKVTVMIAYFFCNLALTLSNKEILNFVSDLKRPFPILVCYNHDGLGSAWRS